MSARRCLHLLLACCAAGVLVPLWLGIGYSGRLSSPQGFYLVPVQDGVGATGPGRPRRAVVAVLDGLGYREALTMGSLALLRAQGQCRITDVGPLTLSRPVYAVLSTGLEQDRTGVRGNDDPGPVAAESLWQVAREAGLHVAAVSELPWWRELFPGGFTSYLMPPRSADYFRLAPLADLTLIHPLYIDEAGHEAGASSPRYREAVARADRELSGLLARLDLQRDLVLVTADHGHSLGGGHGGRQDRVAHVLTCYAGAGVRHREDLGALRATAIAPSLALLLYLRFPATMRAGAEEDGLDVLLEVLDPAAFPPAYEAKRRRALARFRDENQAQLRRWLPRSNGSWSAFYARHRWGQALRALPCLAVLLLVLLTSIASKGQFIPFTLALGVLCTLGAAGLHLWRYRCPRALARDLGAVLLAGAVLSLAHPEAFGFHLGFPLPPPSLYFFPYFAALFLPAAGGTGLLLCLIMLLREGTG